MKKILALLLVLAALFSLTACGRKKDKPQEETPDTASPSEQVLEVRITPNNLYQYFEYKEYPSYIRGEENPDIISAVQISYGFALRDGFTAARLPDKKDTMQVTFTADGVIKSGDFTVDFDTLQYSGPEYSSQRETVTETLGFWPEGDRTFIWAFGNFSKSNILYLENFQVANATGTVYLKTK